MFGQGDSTQPSSSSSCIIRVQKESGHQPLFQGNYITRSVIQSVLELGLMYSNLLCIVQFYLSAVPDHLSPLVQSAAACYVRPVSQGQQAFSADIHDFPVRKPITKITAKLQVSKSSHL